MRLPKRVMLGLCWVIAAAVYWPFARLALLLDKVGLRQLAHQFPLSHYGRYSFTFMVGNAFDRFATPIEKRFSRSDISAWLARYGRDATFSPHTPFWVSLGFPKK